MLIYLLLTIICLILLMSYILSKKDLLAPPNMLCYSFIASIIFAIPNLKLWNFDMGERTFLVVLLGIISFCLGFYIIYFFMASRKKYSISTKLPNRGIYIKKSKFYLFIIIEMITLGLIYMSINSMPGNSIGEKILSYRVSAIVGSEENKISFWVMSAYWFCYASTIIIIYKVLLDYFCDKIFDKKCLVVFILILLMTLLLGTRGNVLYLLISASIMGYVLWSRKYSWKKHINKKVVFKGIFIASIILIAFPTIGLIAVGRGEQIDSLGGTLTENIFSQLSLYIGAPLKLLDLYLYTDYGVDENFPVLGYATFGNFYRFISRNLGIDMLDQDVPLSLKFREDNMVSLGNVYTMFMKYMEDFGFIGLCVLCLIMGMFFAYMYIKIKYARNIYSKKNIDIYTIIYSYVYRALVLAFFAEAFYIHLDWNFIRMLISFKLFELIFLNRIPESENNEK